jgi:pantetheine-phosphate adenylyltransferase
MSTKRIAIFPGTFDPFTRGHESVVTRALDLFDELIIAIGINEAKRPLFTADERVGMIAKIYADNPRIHVEAYSDLTVDFAKRHGARYILRGIRSVGDFEYEKTIADVNRVLTGVETVVLFTEAEFGHISSTIARELMRFGKDVSDFLPKGLELPKR